MRGMAFFAIRSLVNGASGPGNWRVSSPFGRGASRSLPSGRLSSSTRVSGVAITVLARGASSSMCSRILYSRRHTPPRQLASFRKFGRLTPNSSCSADTVLACTRLPIPRMAPRSSLPRPTKARALSSHESATCDMNRSNPLLNSQSAGATACISGHCAG